MAHDNTVETIQTNDTVRVRIVPDHDADSPENWDQLGKIAYTGRYTLGTEFVTRDRLDEIALGIKNGDLIGMPVYAYVHSGATISCGKRLRDGTLIPGNPYHCQWDSGQSGFVYCTKEKAIAEFGKKILTARIKDSVLKCLGHEVEAYDQYLTGDVYGIIVEHMVDDEWVETDSCRGFYGADYAKEEAKTMGEYQAKLDAKEAVQRAEWEARDVVTA